MGVTPQAIDVVSQVVTTRTVGGRRTISKDAKIPSVSVAVPAGSTDLEVICAIDVSQIGVVCISADQDLTVKVNSTGTPAPEIALKANAPYIWDEDSYFTNLLTADVTKFYVSNAGTTDATFEVEGNYDSTPA